MKKISVLLLALLPAFSFGQAYGVFQPGGDLSSSSTWNNQIINAGAVTLAKMANLPANTGICNPNSSAGTPSACPLLVIQATDVNPTNTAATNKTNMAAHITACVTAGGCIIQLGSYTAPIPIDNSSGPAIVLGVEQAAGSTAADTPYNNIVIQGQGWTISQATNRPVSGTVFQGVSTSYPIVAYNYLDNTTDYASQGILLSSLLTGFAINDVGFDTASYCIKIGAKSKSGMWYSRFRNITCGNWAQYGLYLENFQEDDVEAIYVQGGAIQPTGGTMFLGASGGNIYNFGNTTFRQLFGVPDASTQSVRGIVFQARPSAAGVATQLNDVNVYDIQQNGYQAAATTGTATFTTGSANIGVTNLANWPVDMPVIVTANGNGLYKGSLYFVVSNGGVSTPGYAGTGAGNIQIQSQQGNTAAIVSTGSTSLTLEQQGWPALEVVEYKTAAGGVTSFKLDGADLESNATATVVLQYAYGNMQINNITPGLNSSVSMQASSIEFHSIQGILLNIDQLSAQQSIFDIPYANGSGVAAAVGNQNAPGFCLDQQKSTAGLNLGQSQYPNNGGFACDVQSSVTGAAHWWQPNVPMGQKSVYFSWGSSPGSQDASFAGSDVFKATATGVAIGLNTASSSNSSIGGSGQAVNTTTGLPYTMFNDGANLFTMTAPTGQYFNNLSPLGAINIPPYGLASVRAEGDTSVGFYQVESLSPNATITSTPAVSGCGTAANLVGGINASGYAGSFSVGTGASPCTFVITIPIPAPHGWVCNADDITTGPTHLPNAAAASTTSCTVKGNATTSDVVQFSAVPF